MRHLRNAIRGIRYGSVTVIVQDGIVVQIDRTEKTRLDYDALHRDGAGI
ncbi:MAG: YezD family protein [Armatimonadota bacterium]|nr:YezD family protein [Armatimonadota bacterium]